MFNAELELNGNVFFTSDTHFSHERAMRIFNRNFKNTDEMDEKIIENINKTVKKDDILVHLGDFAGDLTIMTVCHDYWLRLNCKKIYFVYGNHDLRQIGCLFTQAFDQVSALINGQPIFLNHYSMISWNKSHHGSWHLYGHNHGLGEELANKLMPGRRAMDVGIDNHPEFRPFAFDEIKSIIGDRPGFDICNLLKVDND